MVRWLKGWSKEEVMADVEKMLRGMFKDAYRPPLAYEVRQATALL